MINKCRSCNSRNLVPVLDLQGQYLSDFVDKTYDMRLYPLSLVLCTECTLVQLRESTPPEVLYTENYGYKSGINGTIKADLKEIVEKALKLKPLKEGDIWLSIGENDGTLLTFVPNYVIKIACEPIKKLARECEKIADIVINDFWSYEAYEKEVTEEKLSNLSKRNSKEILSQSEKLEEG